MPTLTFNCRKITNAILLALGHLSPFVDFFTMVLEHTSEAWGCCLPIIIYFSSWSLVDEVDYVLNVYMMSLVDMSFFKITHMKLIIQKLQRATTEPVA